MPISIKLQFSYEKSRKKAVETAKKIQNEQI